MSQEPPVNITASKSTRTVTILWQDGHTSIYPFHLLRAGCPCAVCRGGHEKMRQEPDESVFTIVLPESPTTTLVNIESVGNYAISLVWSDGHREGIFSWDYLRALCPCQKCRERI